MNVFRRLFNRRSKVMVFVDYEYWFYSYKTLYQIRPDLKAWRDSLTELHKIDDIMVFANFSSPGLGNELDRIREITNTIIETGGDSLRHKKDMSDFVMLDYIYQCADSRKDIDTYILFTGDGHFQSVVKYLTQKKKKKVIMYGVTDSFSGRLQTVADEVHLLPANDEVFDSYMRYVILDLANCFNNDAVIPTIKSTTEAVARQWEIPEDLVRASIIKMLDKGYLYQRFKYINYNRRVKVLALKWEKLIEEGIWDPEKEQVHFPKKTKDLASVEQK